MLAELLEVVGYKALPLSFDGILEFRILIAQFDQLSYRHADCSRDHFVAHAESSEFQYLIAPAL